MITIQYIYNTMLLYSFIGILYTPRFNVVRSCFCEFDTAFSIKLISKYFIWLSKFYGTTQSSVNIKSIVKNKELYSSEKLSHPSLICEISFIINYVIILTVFTYEYNPPPPPQQVVRWDWILYEQGNNSITRYECWQGLYSFLFI